MRPKDQLHSAFIRAGEKVEFDVPTGSYKLYYATGVSWYGVDLLFGPKTEYYKADDIFTFSQGTGWTVELFEQVGGNLETKKISETEFKKHMTP